MADSEWDACEDCLGTGGHRDDYGEGQCGSCGGRGRRPANDAARDELRVVEARRQDAIYERLRDDDDSGIGRADAWAEEQAERHADGEHAIAPADGCPDCEAAAELRLGVTVPPDVYAAVESSALYRVDGEGRLALR